MSTGLLSAVADPIRWQLIAQLSQEESRCVCRFRTEPEIPANLLSYHLKTLRDAGLVESERRGRKVHYWVAADAGERLRAALPC